MAAAGLGRDRHGQRLEGLDRGDQRLGRLRVEEHAGAPCRVAAAAHRLQRAAAAVGDHRRAAGLGLDRGDAEILLGGEDEGARALHVVDQRGVVLEAEHRHVRAGGGAHLVHVGPVADDHQPALRHAREGLDDHRHALVRHHARGGQVEVLLVGAQREARHIHRRMHHAGLAPVDLAHPPADEGRVGDEAVDAGGGAAVPQPHVVQHRAGEGALQATLHAGLAQVLVLHVPGVADRRMDVADMELVRPGQHALGHRVARRDDQVIARQVMLLDRQRHQRQVVAEAPARARQALDEGGARDPAAQEAALAGAEKVDHRIQVGLRIDLQQLLDHLLAAGMVDQPLMDDGDALGAGRGEHRKSLRRNAGPSGRRTRARPGPR